MASPSQSSHTIAIRSLRNLVDQEITKGIKLIKQPPATTAPRMSLPETVTAMVLGLNVHILALYCDEETRQTMISLAKTTPVLLTYTAGEERQKALHAVLQLQKRAHDPSSNPLARSFYEQPTHTQTHFLTSTVREMPLGGPRGYARIDYIPCDVVPLVDYWPDFVRKAFAMRCWRFSIGDNGAEGCDGVGVVVLEIMEGRLDIIEWLIEMEEKRKMAMRRLSAGDRTRGGIWPVSSLVLGQGHGGEGGRDEGGVVMDAARMMDVLKI